MHRILSSEVGPKGPDDIVVVRRLVLVIIGIWMAVAVVAGVLLQPKGTGDAYQHIDYIYQVANGSLPAPTGHLWDPVDFDHQLTGRQYASAHPPLYAALMSQLVGGLLDSNWPLAVAILRLVNIILGALGIAALAWLGWQFPRTQRGRIAVGMAALGGASFTYVRFGSEVYLDMLVTVCATAALAVAAGVLSRGLTASRVGMLIALCALGMGTKATFVTTLVIVVVAVFVSPAVTGNARIPRSWYLSASSAIAVVVLGLVPWLGFYWRNAELSGSWYRNVPKSPVGTRSFRSLEMALWDETFWLNVPSKMLGARHGLAGPIRGSVSLILFAVLVSLTTVVLVSTVRSYRHSLSVNASVEPAESRAPLAIVVMLAAQLGAAHAMQLSHATGYGQYNPRYYLTATASLALLTGYGVAMMRWRALAIPIVLAVLFTGIIRSVWTISRAPSFRGITWAQLGVPDVALAWVFGALAAGGLLTLGLLLHRYGHVVEQPPGRSANRKVDAPAAPGTATASP